MGCLFVLLAAFAPRFVVLFAWIARPSYFDSVFDSWIWPLLGLIFLPFTTLMWLLLGAPPLGVHGWDWLWIALAVVLDLSHYANTYGSGTPCRWAWDGVPRHRPPHPRRTGESLRRVLRVDAQPTIWPPAVLRCPDRPGGPTASESGLLL